MDSPTLEEIKNSIENWKWGANRAYPNLLTWEQVHWLIDQVQTLQYQNEQLRSTSQPESADTNPNGKSGAW